MDFQTIVDSMSAISGDTASAVLETTIKLRGTADFRATIKEVVADIRRVTSC